MRIFYNFKCLLFCEIKLCYFLIDYFFQTSVPSSVCFGLKCTAGLTGLGGTAGLLFSIDPDPGDLGLFVDFGKSRFGDSVTGVLGLGGIRGLSFLLIIIGLRLDLEMDEGSVGSDGGLQGSGSRSVSGLDLQFSGSGLLQSNFSPSVVLERVP